MLSDPRLIGRSVYLEMSAPLTRHAFAHDLFDIVDSEFQTGPCLGIMNVAQSEACTQTFCFTARFNSHHTDGLSNTGEQSCTLGVLI